MRSEDSARARDVEAMDVANLAVPSISASATSRARPGARARGYPDRESPRSSELAVAWPSSRRRPGIAAPALELARLGADLVVAELNAEGRAHREGGAWLGRRRSAADDVTKRSARAMVERARGELGRIDVSSTTRHLSPGCARVPRALGRHHDRQRAACFFASRPCCP